MSPTAAQKTSPPAVHEWVQHLQRQGYSVRTVQLRARTVQIFARSARVQPHHLSEAHVLAYFSKRQLAPATRNNYLAALRQWSQFIGVQDITEHVRRPKNQRRRPRPVSEATLVRLLQAAPVSHPVRAWLVLGAYVGLRSAESAALTVEALEEQNEGWALRLRGKGGHERVIPVPSVVVEALQPWIGARRGRLWPRATAAAVQKAVIRVAAEAGVRCSSHMLRHRYGTQVYRVSRDLLLTQQLMGHASPATTQIYVDVAMDQGPSVVAQLPGAESSSLRLVGSAS